MKIFAFILILILNPISAFSQDFSEKPVTEPSQIISQVNIFSQKTISISADFRQVKEMSFMEEQVTSSGMFYFQKENMMRWEYTDPFDYAIILSGERIRIIDEGKTRDFDTGSNRIFMEISQVMTGMISGTLLSSNQFTASWFESAGYYRAVLLPTGDAMKDYLVKIEIKLDKSDYSIDELKMSEKSGDYTLITFSNKKLNEKIPADIFRLD